MSSLSLSGRGPAQKFLIIVQKFNKTNDVKKGLQSSFTTYIWNYHELPVHALLLKTIGAHHWGFLLDTSLNG